MTTQEQKIAVAYWSGLTNLYCEPGSKRLTAWNGDARVIVPDYSNDLNSMEAAEAALVGREMIQYQAILHEICPHNPHVASWHLIHASAAQRCEALCRTLFPEKW